MFRLKQCNCCSWILGLIGLSNGVCVMTISSLLLCQTVHLLNRQQEQNDKFADVNKDPFKQNNWMKSAVPLVIASTLGVISGGLQTVASVISLVMSNSKSIQLRRLGWLMWIAACMIIFSLSSLSFGLAVMLKAHESRDLNDSVSFWKNYQSKIADVTHNLQGHAFCSVLAWNCAFLLVSMAVVAGQAFRQQNHNLDNPHLLLGM